MRELFVQGSTKPTADVGCRAASVVKQADVLVPTVTDRIDADLIARPATS